MTPWLALSLLLGPAAASEGDLEALLPSAVVVVDRETRGSGWIIDARGYVVTNAHVVADAPRMAFAGVQRRVVEVFPGLTPAAPERRRFAVEVSFDRGRDLAVLRILDAQPWPAPALTLASADPEPGGTLVAILASAFGRPASVLRGTVTERRTYHSRWTNPQTPTFYTTAPGIYGVSGAAVVERAEGKVVGVFYAQVDDTLAARQEKEDDHRSFLGVSAVHAVWNALSPRTAAIDRLVAGDLPRLLQRAQGTRTIVPKKAPRTLAEPWKLDK